MRDSLDTRMQEALAMQRMLLALMTVGFVTFSAPAVAQVQQAQLVDSSTAVLQEIMAVPAKQIPQSLLADARGVAIIPNVIKGGFVIGVRHGRGVLLIRDDNGIWQPPMFVSFTGGSVGWQAGLQATDVVLVFKTRKSVEGIVGGKLTIGVDAAAAAGPVGRQANAATDALLRAEILSYSRSRGLFAGLALDGSALQVDQGAGFNFYRNSGISATGQPLSNAATVPPSASRLMNQLAQYTGAPPTPQSPQMAPAAAARVPVASQLVPASEVLKPSTEAVRAHLCEASRRLEQLLDPTWKQYLALPREVYVPDGPPRLEDLQASLKNFDAVAANQQYQALASRPEFSSTRHLLREYVNAYQATPSSQLQLPAPPR
jgi:lipid-binding SYLF domain-containing protein